MDHHHRHDDAAQDVSELFTQETWDARYSESERIWSGRPNARLVEHAADLAPGDALDVGAGEGGDAVWLAGQGWHVTALDVSEVALSRTAAHATEAGVADRVSVLHHDLMTGAALPGTYDLVSAQYLHPPTERFAEIIGLLADAVRPGGTLLVVGHHPDDALMKLRGGHRHTELLFLPDKVAALLPESDWDVRFAGAPTREVEGPEGPVSATDTVVVAVRR
jgi:SAM-dependent methyltransferase